MIESLDTIERADVCGICGASVGGRRYVLMDAGALRDFCSEACLRAAQSAGHKRRWKTRRRVLKVFTIGVAVAGACLAPHQGQFEQRLAPTVPATAVQSTSGATPALVPAGWFGPEWPPTETSLLAALGRDAWMHPLAGPVRRMPRNDTRVFGANRPGNRAVECRNGHCGVDLGGEIWGEHVHAVHDGVVEYVQRGANAQHGGEFVRIAHRGGSVITQYFHLAAIRRGIERGVTVKSGDVIGLVGDTGVKDSPPHLHFSISIRPSPDRPEKYMDPEPLIALWPLRVPIDGGNSALVTTVAEPGVPLGSAPPHGRGKKGTQQKKGGTAGSDVGEAGESAGDEPASGSAGAESSGDE